MKTSDLLLESDEPIELEIMRNAIKKGTPVFVYYKGDGGMVDSIEWDGTTTKSSIGTMVGAVSFKLTDGRWVVIGADNLENMELKKRVDVGDKSKHSLVLKMPPTRTNEAMIFPAHQWVDLQDAEIKGAIKELGWYLNRPPTYALNHGTFGGDIKASAAAQRSLLDTNTQRRMVMKVIAKKLLALHSRGLRVTTSPYHITDMNKAGSRRVQDGDTVDGLVGYMEHGVHIRLHKTTKEPVSFGMYWTVSIPTDIVPAYHEDD